jgi:hypothetical protein
MLVRQAVNGFLSYANAACAAYAVRSMKPFRPNAAQTLKTDRHGSRSPEITLPAHETRPAQGDTGRSQDTAGM